MKIKLKKSVRVLMPAGSVVDIDPAQAGWLIGALAAEKAETATRKPSETRKATKKN